MRFKTFTEKSNKMWGKHMWSTQNMTWVNTALPHHNGL